jgi:hypothetical protein
LLVATLLCAQEGQGGKEAPPITQPQTGQVGPFTRAQWIWSRGDPLPHNFYLYCRKAFTLKEKATAALIHVTADSRYKLYANGTFVGRGPVRSDQRWQYYDTYDITPFLHLGENVVAAIVHQYGVPTHSYTLGRGGVLLQGEVREERGGTVQLDTDESWRVIPSPAWDRDTPRVSPAIMWAETYDARKEPLGWQRPGFDDSHWERPVLLGRPPVSPWENLIPRDIPFLLEKEIFPKAILDQGVLQGAPSSLRLNLAQVLGTTEGDLVYLFAYLRSSEQQRVRLYVQGTQPGGPQQLWINRIPYPSRPLSPIAFPVERGWNELLLKVGQIPGASLDLTVGPAGGQSYQAIEWYAERTETDRAGRPRRTGSFLRRANRAPVLPDGDRQAVLRSPAGA